MTLPSSGLLTMQDINVEMGRAAGTPFTLDDADVRALAGVPSGPYSMSAFYGKSRATVRNPLNSNVFDTRSSGTAHAYIDYNPNGSCGTNSGHTVLDWLSPLTTGIGAGYYLKFTVTSGPNPTSGGLSPGTWYQLNVARRIGHTRSVVGIISSTYQVSIATSASDGAVVATGTLQVDVERDNEPG